jgi:hypothetical protein
VYSDDEETRKWSEVNRPCVGGDMDGGMIGQWVAMVVSLVFVLVKS